MGFLSELNDFLVAGDIVLLASGPGFCRWELSL